MLRKTKLISFLISVYVGGVLGIDIALAAVPKFPLVSEIGGQAWVTGKDGKRVDLKPKVVLHEKALLETSLAGYVKVELDENRKITLLGASELSIPIIGPDRGEAPILILKSGSFRWQQDVKKSNVYNIALRSDLYEFLAPVGDYIFSMDPARAYAGVKVISGDMRFSALNGEESVQVKTGQQAGFQGVVEGKEIAYDVLLKGRKIPRGKLTAVSILDNKEVSQFEEEKKAQEKALKAKSAATKKAAEKEKREGKICVDPGARFNECAWVCQGNPKSEKKKCLAEKEGVSCLRKRCNANGEWADETRLDAEKASTLCAAKPVVAPCDY